MEFFISKDRILTYRTPEQTMEINLSQSKFWYVLEPQDPRLYALMNLYPAVVLTHETSGIKHGLTAICGPAVLERSFDIHVSDFSQMCFVDKETIIDPINMRIQ